MSGTALDLFAGRVRDSWGPLTSTLIASCEARLAELLSVPASEPWVAGLRDDAPDHRELYRDPVHGFLLLAHTEAEGRYRPPHDHGRSWVIYGVLDGEMEMGTYAPIAGADGTPRLVKRDTTRVRAGDVQVYLPGDVHDTRCISGPAIQFRFTERDLSLEQITRYVEQDGRWIAGTR